MVYNINKFNAAVRYYQNRLKNITKDNIFLIFHLENKEAYYSIAPLSRACHNLGKSLHVNGFYKNDLSYQILKDIWDVFKKYKKNKRVDEKTASLIKFIDYVDKKSKGKFKPLFEKPQILVAEKNQFCDSKNRFSLNFKTEWLEKKESWKKLIETGTTVWDQVYNLKKGENVGISFELIPKTEHLEKPISDLLSNFVIAEAMFESVKNRCKNLNMGASSPRYSSMDYPDKTSDLMATLLGCEYDKEVKEKPFILFKKVSKSFNIDKLKPNDAIFAIFGKGTHGRHIFGETIGYPTLNKKSRWSSPGGMFYKFSWAPQAKYETRDPLARIGFTDTIPIKAFIETCNVDWFEMHRKNQKITNILNKSKTVHVGGGKTNFVVGLTSNNSSKRRYANNSDIDIRSKIDKDYYKRTGQKTGTMANLPGGESFITPEWVEGILYGDVVINIDDSYTLSEKEPLVINFQKTKYSVLSGPKKIVDKLKEKKKEVWTKLLEQEKNKSLPKEIINLKKDNFEKVGEFAINTNPNAKLSDYLIINEKIADMMHVALGSGFDDDRATDYHYDIVFNSKNQKLNVYSVDKNKKKHWIIKKGKMII